MPTLVVWLLSIAWPIVKRVLLAMGIGYVTYECLGMLGLTMKQSIIELWGQMGSVSLQFLSLAGFPQALGIILCAYTAKAAMRATAHLAKIL